MLIEWGVVYRLQRLLSLVVKIVRNRKKFTVGEVIEELFADSKSENEHEYIMDDDDDVSDSEHGSVPRSDSDHDYEFEEHSERWPGTG